MTKKTEEFKVSGADVVKKIKELIKEGNIRKITIKDKEGKSFAGLHRSFAGRCA